MTTDTVNPSILGVFQRGTAQVRWCEDVIVEAQEGDSQRQRWIAETYNTISNAALILASLVWIVRWLTVKEKPMNYPTVLLRECFMLCIGLGSAWFHAHQSLFAQYSDEIPMSIILLVSNHALDGIHPWLAHSESRKRYHALNYAIVAVFWGIYFQNGKHEVFTTGFGVQLVLSLWMNYDAGHHASVPPTRWWYAVYSLIFAQIMWQTERHRFRNDNCLAPGTMILHPLWHVGAALYYYWGVQFWYEVEKQVRAKSKDKKVL